MSLCENSYLKSYSQEGSTGNTIRQYFVGSAESLVFVISVVATVLHFKGAKRLNRVALFHAWHCLYCFVTGLFWILDVTPVVTHNFSGCKFWKVAAIWTSFPSWVTWLPATYYFFAHFDRIFTRERPSGRRGRLRKGLYATGVVGVLIYNVVMGLIDYQSVEDCKFASNVTFNVSQFVMVVFLTPELIWLTFNFWKACYGSSSEVIALKTHFKVAACGLVTISVLSSLISSLIGFMYCGDHGTVFDYITGIVVPSYFTLFFLWDRHYLGSNIVVNDDDDDDDDDDHHHHRPSPFSRETELQPFPERSSITNPLFEGDHGSPESSTAVHNERKRLALVLPLQSRFNLRALLGARQKLVIEENLQPPDSTPLLVRLFVTSIALPAAEAYRQQHDSDTRKLLERFSVQRGGADTMEALEKQEQFDTLKEQAQALSLQVSEWVTALRRMLEVLPTEPIVTRDDIGVEEGWRPFKPSSAKKAVSLALWPTNLHTCSATIRAPATRPLSLTVTTYGAPSAHVFGFKDGGWSSAEKKLKPATTRQQSNGRITLTRRQSSQTLMNANEALDQLRCKFDVSGRSCVCMSQALAAAVAAAVQKLEDCVEIRDGALVRQWVSIGLLVHEVSLLSTFGKENGMIDDMATALDRLNLTLRLKVKGAGSAGATAAGSIFHVAGLRAVPQGDGSERDAAASRVVGRKVVTLEVHSTEVFTWLVQQVVHTANTSDLEEGGGPDVSADSVLDIAIHPVMLTLGVNEMQTLANKAGDTSLQTDINRKGLEGLKQYLEAFREFRRHEKRTSTPLTRTGATLLEINGAAATNDGAGVEERKSSSEADDAAANTCAVLLASLESLINLEASLDRLKTVDILMKSCFAARLLKGARTTSCKSAKDRTSMFYTLELVRLAEERGLFGETAGGRSGVGSGAGAVTKQSVLELLRGVNGVRLQNCNHNIGKAVFSFNKVQVAALPSELKPPLWTIGGGSSS